MPPVRTMSRARALVVAILAVAAATPGSAQETVLEDEGYLTPPDPIADALRAPWHRNARLDDPSPDAGLFVVEVRDRRMPPLSLLARDHHHLGGLQVDPAANRVRDATTNPPDGLRLVSSGDGDVTGIETPDGAKVSGVRWSPDGSALAYFAHFDDATHIYVADPGSGESRRVTGRPVLLTLTTAFDWSADGRYIFTVLVPEDRGPEPAVPAVPPTPRVDLTSDEENQLRTYPDLLETPHERALVEYYGTGQLARIDVDADEVTEIGEPALIEGVDAAPDGRHAVVTTMEKPFSKIVPVYRFARTLEIWDDGGEILAEVESRPVRDGADDDDRRDRRREIAWRPDGEGLGFLQREPRPDDGDDGDDAGEQEETENDDEPRKDRVMRWLPPYDSTSLEVIYESEDRLSDLRYSADARTLFLEADDGEEDEERLIAVDLDADTTWVVATDDTEDAYDDPGELVTLPARPDAPVARASPDGAHVYLEGTVYHEDPLAEAPRPFLDRAEIRTGETTRLFESAPDRYERVVEVLDDAADRIVLRRESPTDVPDYFTRELDDGGEERLTENEDHAPDITGARREEVWATRADGLEFIVEITLPRGYAGEERLPAIFWHYPREYEDEDAYREDIRDFNKNAFPRMYPRSMEKLVRLGYAVVSPDIPIVGPRERWNDYYVLHLRNSHAAAIDALDARGWIDRSRLAVGGHSYGGFGTINSMIQTPFFKAGIAGSANSNRTLTPAGFQREPRMLWEARETYERMSPLFWMNEISGALLLYHGLDDQNVGTFPDHSVRSFHALNALGKTAALYMYPYEEHGPDAEETIMDLWARWTAWLDRYVKNAGEMEEEEATTDASSSGGG